MAPQMPPEIEFLRPADKQIEPVLRGCESFEHAFIETAWPAHQGLHLWVVLGQPLPPRASAAREQHEPDRTPVIGWARLHGPRDGDYLVAVGLGIIHDEQKAFVARAADQMR